MSIERLNAHPLTFCLKLIVLGTALAACHGGGATGGAGAVGGNAANTSPPGAFPPPATAGPPSPAGGPAAEANRAPWIGGTPGRAVLSGAMFSFRPTASDADGDVLTFNIVNPPIWATFDARNGRLRGVPGAGDVGRYDGIRIAVSDGRAGAQLPAFGVDVVATALGTMTISWLPATQHEDGTPLMDLGGHKIYWGTAKRDYANVVLVDNPGITIYVIDGLLPGTYYLAMSTLDEEGVESELSPPVRAVVRPRL